MQAAYAPVEHRTCCTSSPQVVEEGSSALAVHGLYTPHTRLVSRFRKNRGSRDFMRGVTGGFCVYSAGEGV